MVWYVFHFSIGSLLTIIILERSFVSRFIVCDYSTSYLRYVKVMVWYRYFLKLRMGEWDFHQKVKCFIQLLGLLDLFMVFSGLNSRGDKKRGFYS